MKISPAAVKVSVVRAEPEDLDEILSMDRQCFPFDPPPEFPEWTAWWLATVDGVTVGYAGATWSRQWSDAIYLARVGVLPAARGLRLQLRLIRARENWGRRSGAAWSITDTSYDNVRSTNTLIRAGYRAFVPTTPWKSGAATFWRRQLRAP